MPFDKNFADALIASMADAGWHTMLPQSRRLPNPLDLTFAGRTHLRLIIYA